MGAGRQYGAGRVTGMRLGREEEYHRMEGEMFRKTAHYLELISKNTGRSLEEAMDVLELNEGYREQLREYLGRTKERQGEDA